MGNDSVGQSSDLSQLDSLPYPPGFTGHLSRAIEHNSYLPIKDVSIVAAIAMLAGVCGRGYRTPTDKDLALYMILVALSGIGKDGIHEGIPSLIRLAGVPSADNFIRQVDFKSGPALHKAILMNPGFLNLQGEFGRKLKRMANPADGPMQEFRTVMTNAYGKQFLDGAGYSKSEDCLAGIPWPALSFLGETTPETFLESLTADMMEEGFLSRFLVISYLGDRPPPNPERGNILSDYDLDYFQALLRKAIEYQGAIGTPDPITVEFAGPMSEQMFKAFDEECRAQINGSNNTFWRAVWNRAYLKALKLASLLAAADRWAKPRITVEHGDWAMLVVRRDITIFTERMASGDIGNDDTTRRRKVMTVIYEGLTTVPLPASYDLSPVMAQAGIVTRSYLQKRTAGVAAFRNYSRGSTEALNGTIRALIADGYIEQVTKETLKNDWSYSGEAYRITKNLQTFRHE